MEVLLPSLELMRHPTLSYVLCGGTVGRDGIAQERPSHFTLVILWFLGNSEATRGKKILGNLTFIVFNAFIVPFSTHNTQKEQ